ncbi:MULTISPECIES: BMP family protein [unclassified Herbaspirillum]|uniref:BMP family lipoprotein n=1 Tax=unclassified Herbaspirillum TaxID=2624150 RepID=UPI00114F0B7F|nr:MULTISPECIES: BMP family ABC transporter substrate-binding protein [unclassified Herbaspirillum]MBB5391296.1 basic membrane protein A [Herbaspirillum sp. SJZ102]TQK13017.1 nucleoside-binding protein [Herbaspirillum sp. SJZ130]TQK15021.1 nucleoside-binding protein [Herbaspirillum sp. SJZ106]
MTQTLNILLKRMAWGIAAVIALSLLGRLADRVDAGAGGSRLRAVLFVNGTLGDKSFFDSAAAGMRQARQTLPVTTRIVEGGADPTRWESALADLADSGEYDLIVAGTFTMVPYVQKLAAQFPRMRFIVFDAAVDYAHCACANVHSILFRQNEGAYLAGYLAAMLLRERVLPGAAANGSLGVVGGMQFPVIEDYMIGFRAGARAFDPAIVVASQYANGFSDPAAGKDIANAQMAAGAALIFHAAGATGQGVNEAVSQAHRYAIGVDLDQYALAYRSNPQRAGAIVTSVMKNIDVAIVGALGQHLQGQLPWGRARSLGLAEGGVGLAPHSQVMDSAPAAIGARLDAVRADIVAGRLQIPSALARAGSPG